MFEVLNERCSVLRFVSHISYHFPIFKHHTHNRNTFTRDFPNKQSSDTESGQADDGMDDLPALSPEQCTLLAEVIRTNTNIAEGMENLNFSGLSAHNSSRTITAKTHFFFPDAKQTLGITAEGAQEEYCTIFEALPHNISITTVAFGPGMSQRLCSPPFLHFTQIPHNRGHN